MDNYCKMITANGFVRALAIDSTKLCEIARAYHDTTPVMTAALGRTLTAASLMGSLLKDEHQSLTLQIRGDGPGGLLLAVSDAGGHVRGTVENPHVDLPLNAKGKLDVAGAVGTSGNICVIKDLHLKEPYIGRTPIVSGEIAEDITHYLTVSEQSPSATSLGVLVDRDWSVKRAGGFLIELLPGADELTIAKLEWALSQVRPVTELLEEGLTPEDVLRTVLEEFVVNILDTGTKSYRCDCSQDRVERALLSLGSQDLRELAGEQEVTEVGCQFCAKRYRFTAEHLLTMAQTATNRL